MFFHPCEQDLSPEVAQLCSDRHVVLKSILDRYTRDITVFDLGAVDQGYHTFRIALNSQFDSTCIMMEHNDTHNGMRASTLLKLCDETPDLNNMILLEKKISPRELEILGLCEHFDVILAFDVLERFGDAWQQAAQAIIGLGDNIIFHTAVSDDDDPVYKQRVQKFQEYLVSHQPTMFPLTVPLRGLAGAGEDDQEEECLDDEGDTHENDFLDEEKTAPSREITLFWVQKWRETLAIPCWRRYREVKSFKGRFKIYSTWESKGLYKKLEKVTYPWIRGLNAYNFVLLNGTFPHPMTLREEVLRLSHVQHNDFKLANMLVQGTTMHLFDFYDARMGRFNKMIHKKRLRVTLKLLQ